mmetsp:Transcript_14691/g.58728  ORF Transcript_14691/g.58728 Transcript_14691/m.58728 type:complete len:270 (-) Transcript_14691:934-1743(-)
MKQQERQSMAMTSALFLQERSSPSSSETKTRRIVPSHSYEKAGDVGHGGVILDFRRRSSWSRLAPGAAVVRERRLVRGDDGADRVLDRDDRLDRVRLAGAGAVEKHERSARRPAVDVRHVPRTARRRAVRRAVEEPLDRFDDVALLDRRDFGAGVLVLVRVRVVRRLERVLPEEDVPRRPAEEAAVDGAGDAVGEAAVGTPRVADDELARHDAERRHRALLRADDVRAAEGVEEVDVRREVVRAVLGSLRSQVNEPMMRVSRLLDVVAL